jgi:hypothetical protein
MYLKSSNGLIRVNLKETPCTLELSKKFPKWLAICKKLTLDPCLSPCTSINSKRIKDLNFRPQTLKLVLERVGNTLEVIGIGKDFLSKTPAAQQLRESGDKWDFIKLKSFCTKEMVSKLKRPPQSGRKYLSATHQTKD